MYGFNPYDFNPRRRKHRRNPTATAAVSKWTQGTDLQDVGFAIAGLAASSMIPPYIIKDTTTTGSKLARLGVSLVAAVGAGYLVKRFASPSAGKAAIIGGLAGSGVMAVQMLTGFKIGNSAPVSIGHPISLPSFRGIGAGEVVSPSYTRDSENVGIINP